MSGLSIGRSLPRSCPGAKTLRRCRNNNVETDDVIIIDVETDSFDNVVIIDVPKSLPKKTQRSSMHHMEEKKPSFENVICLDDDESNDSAGTSSENFLDVSTPVRLSKCKRTYSGNASRRNCFGLTSDSETLSDSDYSDCEVVEDSSGEVQERWEKASSRRKRDFLNSHSDVRDDNNEKDDDSSCFRTKGDIYFGLADVHVEKNRKRTTKFRSRVHEEPMNKYTSETETLFHNQTDHSSTRLSDDEKGFVSRNSSLSKGFSGKLFRNSHDEESELQEDDISMLNIQQEEDKDIEKRSPSEETYIISVREKQKETDEYKRRMEEELASRNQALQIQAEEARNQKRLLKRKKAESLRLSDMERRQKERIEEVRNIQKKDEDNKNMKERILAEVMTELRKLEVSCNNMASLLHLLGISVGSWPNPSPQEVQTAYKRALLTFHPDRASQSDIRQQVEAEEKFKLLIRLKEKYKFT
ncbi:hypothetical protein CASFOL_020723 [Castilleja foliolosa]|uniref:J domain-containing protein n=1 Tax=Castilleja foliolosa TaxID=1961234 RepID=A0ABD3D5A7_9LAMI